MIRDFRRSKEKVKVQPMKEDMPVTGKAPVLVTRSSMPPFEEYSELIKELWESRWLTNMSWTMWETFTDGVTFIFWGTISGTGGARKLLSGCTGNRASSLI